jgi:Fe-S cluster biogenesis protein NfuA
MTTEYKQKLIDRINVALDTVRPHLKSDGGDIEIVDITPEMLVQIRWVGMCETCSMNGMTLKAGIEYTVKSQVPEILGVQAMNPYLAGKA